jgi:hypothetical protein
MSLLMLVSTLPSALKVIQASIYRLVAEEACTSSEEEEEEKEEDGVHVLDLSEDLLRLSLQTAEAVVVGVGTLAAILEREVEVLGRHGEHKRGNHNQYEDLLHLLLLL